MMSKNAETWLPTRQSLLSRLKDWDDHDSWREFFNTYWKLIFSVARKAGLSEPEAREVVQDTIITVSKQMPDFKYDRKKGSFKNWLRHTTQWRIIDQKRKRKNDYQFHAADPEEIEERLANGAHDNRADPELEALWQTEWEQNLMEVAIERVRPLVNPRDLQVFDFCTVKNWPAAKVANSLQMIRPQVYYVNKKVTKLIRNEIEKLRAATE